MDSFDWDPAIKKAMDSIDWSGDNNNMANKDIAAPSMLATIGCECSDILMDLMQAPRVENQSRDPSILPQPKFSNFDTKQHSNFLFWKEKFKSNQNISTVEKKDHNTYRIYKKLHQSIQMEQAAFIEYAYQNALHNIKMYDVVLSHVQQCVQKYLQSSKAKLLKRPTLYTPDNNSIPINVTPFTTDPILKNEQHSISTPNPPMLKLPVNFPQKIQRLKENDFRLLGWSMFEDPNVKNLSHKWNADFAISMNALATLIDNPAPFNNEWEIPIFIEHSKDLTSKRTKIIFIGEPFPPKSLDGRKSNYLYYKKAARNRLVQKLAVSLIDGENVRERKEEGVVREGLEEGNSSEVRKENKEEEGNSSEMRENTQEEGSAREENEKEEEGNSSEVREDTQEEGSAREENEKEEEGNSSEVREDTQEEGSAREENEKKEDGNLSEMREDTQEEGSSREEGNMREENEKEEGNSSEVREDTQEEGSAREESDIIKENEEEGSAREEGNMREESEKGSVKEFSSEEEGDLPQLDGASDKKKKRKKKTQTKTKSASSIQTLPNKLLKVETSTEKPSSEDAMLPDSDDDNLVIASEEENEDKVNMNCSENNMEKEMEKKEIKSRKIFKKEISTRRKSKRISNRESNTFANPKKRRGMYIESDSSDDDASLASLTTAENEAEKSKNIANVVDNIQPKKKVKPKKSVDSKITTMSKEKHLITSTPDAGSVVAEKPRKVIAKKTLSKDQDETKNREVKMTKNSNKFLSPVHKPKPTEDNSMSGDLLGQILGDKKGSTTTGKLVVEERRVRNEDYNSVVEKFAIEKEIQKCEGKNYFYKLLSIGGIKLLVRGITHGYLVNGPTVDNPSYVSNATIQTKLEYQPSLGFELMTPHEACMEWLALKFAPQPSTVVRCRVDPLTESLITSDVISNVNRRNAAYLACGFSQLRSNKLLLTILQRLTCPQNFPPASYILYHANSRKTINVRKAVTESLHKRVLYNLEQEYERPGQFIPSSLQSLAWVPLDSEKNTQWQLRNNRVPLLFDIKPENAGNKNGGNKYSGNKNGGNEQQKKKRNKGKPKRRNK